MMVNADGWIVLAAGGFGLLVGSLLNVVIHRIPLMMYRGWLHDSLLALAGDPSERSIWQMVTGPQAHTPGRLAEEAGEALQTIRQLPPLNLALPRSMCPKCGHAISWYENVPLLSYLWLRGRCRKCRTAIGARYPLVELATGLLFAACCWRYGLTPAAALWATCCALLLCLCAIDAHTQLLPDPLNYMLLWLGLGGAALGLTDISAARSIAGALTGYLSLWTVAHLYRLVRRREGMGHGDFKLLAAIGALWGPEVLAPVTLVACIASSAVGIGQLVGRSEFRKDTPTPFGPYLGAAALLLVLWGPGSSRILRWIGA